MIQLTILTILKNFNLTKLNWSKLFLCLKLLYFSHLKNVFYAKVFLNPEQLHFFFCCLLLPHNSNISILEAGRDLFAFKNVAGMFYSTRKEENVCFLYPMILTCWRNTIMCCFFGSTQIYPNPGTMGILSLKKIFGWFTGSCKLF